MNKQSNDIRLCEWLPPKGGVFACKNCNQLPVDEKHWHLVENGGLMRECRDIYDIMYRPNVTLNRPKIKGTGDFLHDAILIIFGEKPTRECSCADRIIRMNSWGPDGCKKHLEEIVDWLISEIDEHKWTFIDDSGNEIPRREPWIVMMVKVVRAIPFGESFIRDRCRRIVLAAIERAEEEIQQKETTPSSLLPVRFTTPMDIVYPIAGGRQGRKKIGSKWNNNELRYSLRSLETYFPNMGKVFIVGHKPDWLTGVVHLPAEDVHQHNKDANLIDKVLLACRSGVSQTFLRLSDDQCLLHSWDGLDVWYQGSACTSNEGSWWERMSATCNYLRSKGRPTYFYDCHAPAPVGRESFIQVASEAAYAPPPGMCINTLYFNSIDIPRQPLGGQKATFHEASSLSNLRKRCRGRLFLGYNEAGLNDDMKQHLAELFPKPSRFEKTTTLSVPPMLAKAVSGGLCTGTIYQEIKQEIEKRRPCNLLVFGCGKDSRLWRDTNEGGRTVFVEDMKKWADKTRKQGCEVIHTSYPTKRDVFVTNYEPPEELRELLQQEWDIVFIDGPKGNKSSAPGRELPIRWASQLAGSPLIFLHDYDRPWEQKCVHRHFKEAPLRIVDRNLGIWKLGEPADEVSEALIHAIDNGWCTEDNYRMILSEVEKRRPCNMLVFGCGHDSRLWDRANRGGRTLFVEDKRRWVHSTRSQGCEVIHTAYKSLLGKEHPEDQPPEELREALRQEWDIVFVDGPRRNRHCDPGRELPIRWASRIAGNPIVFIHDYTRSWEVQCIDKYLGTPPLCVSGSGRADGSQLGMWQLNNKTMPRLSWTYWEGAMPAWIELCLDTMRKNIPGMMVLTPTTLARLYAEHRGKEEPYDLFSGMPALSRACQRSNIVRAWLLKKFGGLWLDADCIALGDIWKLCWEHSFGKDLVTYKYNGKFSVDAMLLSLPEGRVITEYSKIQQRALRKAKTRIHRQILGPPALRSAILSIGEQSVGIVPTNLIDPSRGGRKHGYLAAGDLPEGCAGVMLREVTGKNKLLWTKEQWLDSSCYLSKIFRRALGIGDG